MIQRIHRYHIYDFLKNCSKVIGQNRHFSYLMTRRWRYSQLWYGTSEHASALRSALDLKENRIKELEAELTMVRYTSFRKTGYHTFKYPASATCLPSGFMNI